MSFSRFLYKRKVKINVTNTNIVSMDTINVINKLTPILKRRYPHAHLAKTIEEIKTSKCSRIQITPKLAKILTQKGMSPKFREKPKLIISVKENSRKNKYKGFICFSKPFSDFL